jgi:hypothetical protein
MATFCYNRSVISSRKKTQGAPEDINSSVSYYAQKNWFIATWMLAQE